MADEPKESTLFPSSDGVREDSGLQDILSVSKKIKNKPEDPLADDDDGGSSAEDSGMITFAASSGSSSQADDDDALFGSFSGGLGAAGFGAPLDPPSSSAADLTPLASEGRVKEARPAEVVAKPQPEQKRSPMVAIAVVLGLALIGGAAVMLGDKGDPAPTEVAQAGMSAPEEDAAVGKADEPVPEQPGATAGATPPPEPIPEPDPALLEGETEGLGALDPDAGDPMAMKNGLLENDGTNGVAKQGKWDQGTSYAKNPTPQPEPEAEPEDDPLPLPEPKPKGESVKGGGDGTSDEEVDCLLNPDLPKCAGGGETKPKNTEVLAPKVPDKLSQSQLRDGFNSVKSSAKKCGQQHGAEAGTQVKVHVSIEGATGTVTDVKATGEHAGTPLGDCVEDAVKKAQFQIFKNPSMGADYPLVM